MPTNWGTIPAAATQYQVSDKTIRRWISQGRIEAKRFGSKLIRVNLDSVESMGRPLQYVEGADLARGDV